MRAGAQIDGPKSSFCCPLSVVRGVRQVALALDLDVEALDLLVEGREGNLEAFGGVGLAPVVLLELLDDEAALELVQDVEIGRASCRERV